MKDGQLQRIVDSVAEVTRNGVGAISSEELDTGWQRLRAPWKAASTRPCRS
jgi:hypothetical protein